jgi:hypothetical protein
MKRPALESLSNEALCKLRDEIAALLESRAPNNYGKNLSD